MAPVPGLSEPGYRALCEAVVQQAGERPQRIEVVDPDGGGSVILFPDREAMRPEGAVSTFFSSLTLPLFLLSMILPAIVFLGEGWTYQFHVFFASLLFVVGGGLWFAWDGARDVLRRNRVRAAFGGTPPVGAILLSDSLVLRGFERVDVVGRDGVLEFLVERHAAHGSLTPRSHVKGTPDECEVRVRFRDGFGREREVPVAKWLGHEPPQLDALRSWLGEDKPASEAPPETYPQAYVDAWRDLRRRGFARHLAFYSFMVALGLDAAWGVLPAWLQTPLWVLPALWIGTMLAALLWYEVFRCPRCGQSPRLPLHRSGPDMCMACTLPIRRVASPD